MTKIQAAAPRWASRVQKQKIAQIYKDDANGMHDEELINDVAFTLLARCKSTLTVEDARNGQAACPICEAIVEYEAEKGAALPGQPGAVCLIHGRAQDVNEFLDRLSAPACVMMQPKILASRGAGHHHRDRL